MARQNLIAHLLDISMWLDQYKLIVIFIFGAIFTALVFFRKPTIDHMHKAGLILHLLFSFTTMIPFISLLISIAAISLSTNTKSVLPLPKCVSEKYPECNSAVTEYISQLTQNYIPYSELLGLSVACLFFVSLLWFLYVLREAW